MHFLLTRPKHDSMELAKALRQQGHSLSQFPLLHIEFLPLEQIVPDDFQAILFTSANGVRALAHHLKSNIPAHLPVFTVGDASATEAARLGFGPTQSANGDVVALQKLVTKTLNPKKGPVLHGAGTRLAGDLKTALEGDGFSVCRRALYQANPAQAFNSATRRLLKSGTVSHMPFFSPRTARIFCQLIREEGLEKSLETTTALCLSAAIRDMLDYLPWQEILVADRPDQTALLQTIDIRLEAK